MIGRRNDLAADGATVVECIVTDSISLRGRGGQRAMLVVVCALAMTLLLAPPLHAQETYRLEDDQWKPLSRIDPASPAGQLQSARRELAGDNAKRALELVEAWITQYPNHELTAEALLLQGDAMVAAGNEYKALYPYERVIREYPGSEQYMTALDREFAIARQYAAGLNRKFLGMRLLSAESEAEELFIRIQERAPGSALGEDASMALGEYYYDRGQMRSAVAAYDMFLVNYPRSPRRERAMLRLIQANLATYRGPRFDATGLLEASERIRQYSEQYPAAAERLGTDALLVRIDESMALQLLYNGEWYSQRGKWLSAATMYRRLLADYPQTAAADAAVNRLEKMGLDPVERTPLTTDGDNG